MDWLDRSVALVLFGVVAGAPGQMLRAHEELAQVDVFAADAQGRFVNTLTKDDFEVREDGKPQTVTTFALVDVPISAPTREGAVASPPADVYSNTTPTTGRLYVLVLDGVRSDARDVERTQQAASLFIQRYLEPGDMAAVVGTSGRTDNAVQFTSDRRRLLASVANLTGSVAAGPGDGLAALRSVVDHLAGIRGRRKACVYFGLGVPASASRRDSGDLVAAANRANVSFYTVDPKGLGGLAGLVSAQGGAWSLSQETGGFAVQNTDSLDRGYQQIQRENSSYYLLGYSPSGDPGNVRIRTVDVRTRVPGVTIRARRDYALPKAPVQPSPAVLDSKDVPPVLLPALQYPLRATGIGLTVSAASFRGEAPGAPWAHVVVQIDGRHIDLSGTGALDIATVSVSKTGEVFGDDVRRYDLDFGPDLRARVLDSGLGVQARVPVPPDGGGLRVAVADVSTGRTGSLWIDLDVPDYDHAPISMSGLVISHDRSTEVPTATADETLRASLSGPVSTCRDFSADDTLRWFAEVYQGTRMAEPVVTTTTTIVDPAGHIVFTRDAERSTANPPDDRGLLRVTGTTPLDDLAAGSYVLHLEARLAFGGQTVSREMPFRIVSPPASTGVGNTPVTAATVPAASAAVAPAAAPTRAQAAPQVPVDPATLSLDRVMDRVGRYVQDYGEQLSVVIGVETYTQLIGRVRPSVGVLQELKNAKKLAAGHLSTGVPLVRTLVAEVALVQLPDDWMGFRDVYEVDGQRIGERTDRLQKRFVETPDTAIEQGRRLADESARYNLGTLRRNFNLPTTTLFFMRAANHSRFRFKKVGEDRIDGVRVWLVGYKEVARPTLIKTLEGRDMPVSGTLWVDPTDGRVLTTAMEIEADATIVRAPSSGSWGPTSTETKRELVRNTATLRVTYRLDPRLKMLVPAEMTESYVGPWVGFDPKTATWNNMICQATYSAFKRFETSSRLVIPK